MDPSHRAYGEDRLRRDDLRAAFESREMEHEPVLLDDQARTIVDRTIGEVCSYRGWLIHTQNVRTNHVHLLVSAVDKPEMVLNSVKSWCTRRLREAGLRGPGQRVWSRHGSTVYVWTEEQLARCWSYVVDGQGERPLP